MKFGHLNSTLEGSDQMLLTAKKHIDIKSGTETEKNIFTLLLGYLLQRNTHTDMKSGTETEKSICYITQRFHDYELPL